MCDTQCERLLCRDCIEYGARHLVLLDTFAASQSLGLDPTPNHHVAPSVTPGCRINSPEIGFKKYSSVA